MSRADQYFIQESFKIITEGFSDEAYEVRPK